MIHKCGMDSFWVPRWLGWDGILWCFYFLLCWLTHPVPFHYRQNINHFLRTLGLGQHLNLQNNGGTGFLKPFPFVGWPNQEAKLWKTTMIYRPWTKRNTPIHPQPLLDEIYFFLLSSNPQEHAKSTDSDHEEVNVRPFLLALIMLSLQKDQNIILYFLRLIAFRPIKAICHEKYVRIDLRNRRIRGAQN